MSLLEILRKAEVLVLLLSLIWPVLIFCKSLALFFKHIRIKEVIDGLTALALNLVLVLITFILEGLVDFLDMPPPATFIQLLLRFLVWTLNRAIPIQVLVVILRIIGEVVSLKGSLLFFIFFFEELLKLSEPSMPLIKILDVNYIVNLLFIFELLFETSRLLLIFLSAILQVFYKCSDITSHLLLFSDEALVRNLIADGVKGLVGDVFRSTVISTWTAWLRILRACWWRWLASYQVIVKWEACLIKALMQLIELISFMSDKCVNHYLKVPCSFWISWRY